MQYEQLPPNAANMFESIRAVGYSFEAAVADIVDNSIAAGASRVNVTLACIPRPIVVIWDDGRGMNNTELVQAMRLACQPPSLARTASDLGRFGLGLKSASLSQCRKLTVISKKAGKISACSWDLDVVATRKDWSLCKLESTECNDILARIGDFETESGTAVVWEEFDRFGSSPEDIRGGLQSAYDIAGEHLSLVFHRFIGNKLSISMNGRRLDAKDPFLTGANGRTTTGDQTIRIGELAFEVEAVVLPSLSKWTADQRRLANGNRRLRLEQGFYVYRGRRLLEWGTWFGLAAREEMSKLTRIRVDIPNTMDHLWTLDVKKSKAQPPAFVLNRLRPLVDSFMGKSERSLTHRGREMREKNVSPMWIVNEEPEGKRFRVHVSDVHPFVTSLLKKLHPVEQASFRALLRAIGDSVPVYTLHALLSADRVSDQRGDTETVNFLELAETFILEQIRDHHRTRAQAIELLKGIEPFNNPDLQSKLSN